MSEKIVYEASLIGTGSVVSGLSAINAAASSINAGGFERLTTAAIRASYGINELANSMKGILALQTPFTRRGTTAAIDQGLVPNFDLKNGNIEEATIFKTIKELRKFRENRRNADRHILNEMFGGGAQLLLGAPPITEKSDLYWFNSLGTVINDIYERHQKAEEERERLRKKWKKNNPWSDFENPNYPIVPFAGNGGLVKQRPFTSQETSLAVLRRNQGGALVPSDSYIDAESWYFDDSHAKFRKYKPSQKEWFNWAKKDLDFTKMSDMRKFIKRLSYADGILGFIGKFSQFILVFNVLFSMLFWFTRNIERAIKAVKAFGDAILQAQESWRQLRESHAFGTSMGSLAGQWTQQLMLGGDAASASALWGKLSRETAMIGFGGNGGSIMEAARLFGVNILGSGDYGYATPDEFMRNVVRTMTTLTPEARRALGNTLGLNPYQYWAVTHGEEYYDFLTNRKTLLGSLREATLGIDGREIFSQESNDASRRFEGAWGDFVTSLEELGGVLGEAILPLLTILLDTLNGIVQIISVILDPLAKFINKVGNFLSVRYHAEEYALGNSPTYGSVYARTVAASNSYGGNSVTLNFGDVSLNSLGLDDNATSEQIKERIASVVFDKLGDHLINNRR